MKPETFLDGRIALYGNDCLKALPTLDENSFDSACCDPPYHLTSIVKRFGAENAAPAKVGKTGVYARASAGFMGKKWDGGDVAFRVETWKQILRVLKPGAHLVAFGGTRTYHRMACAIEDAGFEIRDCIQWLYGSGFPKSRNVGKDIDYRGGEQLAWFGPWLRQWREQRGVSQSDLAKHFPSKSGGKTGRISNFELGVRLPTVDDFNLICRVLDLPFSSIQEAERSVIGTRLGDPERFKAFAEQDGNERTTFNNEITAPATSAAERWDGWGTALKPACEPIVLARKPLSESTVAANVLKWGTGALNIDGCRVPTAPRSTHGDGNRRTQTGEIYGGGKGLPICEYPSASSRWPANVIHDGSDEVVGAFPDADGAVSNGRKGTQGLYEDGIGAAAQAPSYGDSGSAARFFYTSKADSDDRLGSKHPTVKPLDLMQYLVRLVTPPKGRVLDPFAGTGTAGEAAWRMGFKAILIEREEEYCNDIRRRMALCLAGPDERQRESIKARLQGKPVDDGPLFGGTE